MSESSRRARHEVGCRRLRALTLIALLLCSSVVRADERIEGREADFRRFSDWAWLALGAATGFVGHELGHVTADLVTGHTPRFVPTKTGPFPFFAISPCCGTLSHAEAYYIASAGFAVGDVSSELILQVMPKIRSRRAAFLKGVLLLDVGLALGYALTGFLESRWPNIGPPQSDINSMARALGAEPWQVGIYLVGPALIDVYRYFVPRSSFAPWVSLQGKALMVGLVLPLL